MIISGLARLGRDAELRHTPQGDAVINLALAFDYGKKGQDGYRPTQWLESQLWGQRAEALAPYLLKGKKVVVTCEDPHIETYQGQNGPGHKLVARIMTLEFAGDAQQGQQSAQQPQQRQQPRQSGGNGYQAAREGNPPPQRAASGFDDVADDIPW